MPLLRNTVSGVVRELPDNYVGLYPFELVEKVESKELEKTEKPVEKSKSKKSIKASK